ncbi:serine/threonine protein kinase, CMGC, CDC2/CDK sub, partial [Lunasporangiospora selenospora]
MTKPVVNPEKHNVESDSDSSDDEDYIPDDKVDIQSDNDSDSGDDNGGDDHEVDPGNGNLSTSRSGRKRKAHEDEVNSKAIFISEAQEQRIALEQASKKSKIDALWAELNAPVARPTHPQIYLEGSAAAIAASGSAGSSRTGTASVKMVTITTSYDFAGETVTVTKEVPEDSKEAKEAALKEAKKDGKKPTPTSTLSTLESKAGTVTQVEKENSGVVGSESVSATPGAVSEGEGLSVTASPLSNGDFDATTESSSDASTPSSTPSSTPASGAKYTTRPSVLDSLSTKKGPARYIRKKSNLDELAATYGVKKPAKLNTLEKSKLDWNQFVGKEGIEDELKHHNKDGYMEKVAFLQRTDERRDEELQRLKKRSEVHKARRKGSGELLALKRILMHNENEGIPITALREIKILRRLRHENVVPLQDIAVHPGSRSGRSRASVYMVFPYMDHDLSGLLNNPKVRLSVPQIKLYMKQLLEGTVYMHGQKILHRDMKAANLLISNNGTLKIADFGLARPFKPEGEDYTSKVVTRWYRPPELFLGEKKYGPAVDMWGIGCVFGEMLFGRPVLQGNSDQDQLDKIFQLCGSPTEDTMPGWSSLPGLEEKGVVYQVNRTYPRKLKDDFEPYGTLAADLMDKLLVLDPKKRLSAYAALDHDYLWVEPLPADIGSLPLYDSSHEYDRQRKHEAQQQQERHHAAAAAAGHHNPHHHPGHHAQPRHTTAG